MNRSSSLYAVFSSEDEIEESGSRFEYDPAVIPYMVTQLPSMPDTATSRYEDIPMQRFNMNPRRRPNLQMPQGVHNSRRLNKSLHDLQVEGRRTQSGTNSEGVYDPRRTGPNGLPRSKSVRQGINQRFLRNEASSNTVSGDIALQMLRHNTVGCINDIPHSAATYCNADAEGFSPRFMRNEPTCSSDTRSDEAYNSGEYTDDVAFSASKQWRGKARRSSRLSDERQYKEAPSDRVYENTKQATECPSVGVDIHLEENVGEKLEDGQDVSYWRIVLVVASITFIASLTGAGVYSLITCAITGCEA